MDIRKSVRSLRLEGRKLVRLLQRDGRALLARSRTQLVQDVSKVRRQVGARAERTVRDLEKRVMKQFHAANAAQVSALERRIARLEELVGDLERRFGAGSNTAA